MLPQPQQSNITHMAALLTALTALAAPNLVLVSLDTTRADALSAYGSPDVPFHDATPEVSRTPVLDAFGEQGVRFDQFYAHAPSTLTSHASMFTGLDPHGHGVVRNGFPLDADLKTLAERLTEAGYDTRAVLGAAALERGTGIDQGFAVYDDASPTLRGIMFQSPAPEVIERTLATVDAREIEKPLFLFVHFFDAHSPYEPPEPYRSRFAVPGYSGRYTDPEAPLKPLVSALRAGKAYEKAVAAVNGRYLGEISYLDAQVGVLLEGLEARGVLDEAVVVIVGDHGEVLSEDSTYAWTHGNNVSDGVLRVPLLLRGFGSIPLAERRVVTRQAPMDQLAPTLEKLLGLDPELGTDFWDLLRPGPVRDDARWPERGQIPVFMEATRPRAAESAEDWNNLPLQRGVLAGGYRLEADPVNSIAPHMATGHPTVMQFVLGPMLAAWDAVVPAHRDADMPAHTRRALEALGYLRDD